MTGPKKWENWEIWEGRMKHDGLWDSIDGGYHGFVPAVRRSDILHGFAVQYENARKSRPLAGHNNNLSISI